MAENFEVHTAVLQNLKDAGCNEEMIQSFIQLQALGEMERMFKLLSKQRRALLDGVHENQRKLDCLDYLLYQMKKYQQQG